MAELPKRSLGGFGDGEASVQAKVVLIGPTGPFCSPPPVASGGKVGGQAWGRRPS